MSIPPTSARYRLLSILLITAILLQSGPLAVLGYAMPTPRRVPAVAPRPIAQPAMQSAAIGLITGRIVDDSSGLPLVRAVAQLVALDGQTIGDGEVASTDERGRYRLAVQPGVARVRLMASGYTGVTVETPVAANRRTDPHTARLTPLAPLGPVISAVVGGLITDASGQVALQLSPGALSQDAALGLTLIGPQGLAGPLPRGWSPIVGLQIDPGDLLFQQRTSLTVTDADGVATDGGYVAARWDGARARWLVNPEAVRVPDPRHLVLDLHQTGHYVILRPDPAPNGPPPATPDQPLPGNPSQALPTDLAVNLLPADAILFTAPGVHTQVQMGATSTSALASGTPLRLETVESFAFTDGSALHPEPGWQDLALFAYPGSGPFDPKANLVATPSRAFTPQDLQLGVLHLAVHPADNVNAPRGALLDSAGGTADAAGHTLVVSRRAVTEPLPVLLGPLAPAQFPGTIPAGLTLISAAFVDLHGGRLNLPATLSAPLPPGQSGAGQILTVRLTEVEGISHLSLLGPATLTADGHLQFFGLTEEGRYAFLRPDQPLGLLTGQVLGAQNQPQADLLVSIDSYPLVSLSNREGRFVLAAPTGASQVTVLDPRTGDRIEQTVTVPAPGANATLNLELIRTPPRVIQVDPADLASGVELTRTVQATFSEPLTPASVTTQTLSLDTDQGPVAGSLSLTPDGRRVTFRPDQLLSGNTTYSLTVTTAVQDLAGNGLAAPFDSHFATVDQIPPPLPPAGNVVASAPDAAGFSTVTGSQGTVEPAWVVVIKNLTTGALTTVVAEADGSFSARVPAGLADRLQLVLRDAAGNETVAAVGRFQGPDGSEVFGAEGGIISGEGGISVDLPPGSVPDGTLSKITPLAEVDLPLPAPDGYPFMGGVQVTMQGITQTNQSFELRIPAPADATPEDEVIVARRVSWANGQKSGWMVVDRAVLVDGDYRTGAPEAALSQARNVEFLNAPTAGDPAADFPSLWWPEEYGFFRAEGSCVSYTAFSVTFQSKYVIHEFFGPKFVFLGPILTADINRVVFPASCNQPLKLEVRDADTEVLLQVISRRTPVDKGVTEDPNAQPPASDDEIPPTIQSHNLYNNYPLDSLRIQFSEKMNQNSVRNNLKVTNQTGQPVAGTVTLFNEGKVVTFEPDRPFEFGRQYTVRLNGAKDLAGNDLTPATPMLFTMFEPRSLAELDQLVGTAPGTEAAVAIGDTVFVAQTDPEFRNVQQLIAFDAGEPDAPRVISETISGLFQLRSLLAVPDVLLEKPDGKLFAYELFSVEVTATVAISMAAALDNDEIPYLLQGLFVYEGDQRLSAKAVVTGKRREREWRIQDQSRRYLVQVTANQITVQTGRDLLVAVGNTDQNTAVGHLELLEIYDVTACTRRDRPAESGQGFCLDLGASTISRKILADPQRRVPAKTTIPQQIGIPNRLAMLHQPGVGPDDDQVVVYVVNSGLGLQAVNVAKAFNMPNPLFNPSNNPEPDGFFRGRFVDVAVLENLVLATAQALGRDPDRLMVFTSQLVTKTATGKLLPQIPIEGIWGVGTGEKFVYDLDGDGRVGDAEEMDQDQVGGLDEIFDLALITTGPVSNDQNNIAELGQLYVLDLSSLTSLNHAPPLQRDDLDSYARTRFSLGAPARTVMADVDQRVAYLELDGPGLAFADLQKLDLSSIDGERQYASPDVDQNGVDDRVRGLYDELAISPRGKLAMDMSSKRPIAYVNDFNAGIELIQICNSCPELTLDFRLVGGLADSAQDENKAKQKKIDGLLKEKAILKSLLDQAAARLQEAAITDFYMLEQGSSSCLWNPLFNQSDAEKLALCGAFKPGASDHDVEVMVPTSQVPLAQQVLDAFINGNPAGLEQLDDLSLFAMPRQPFEKSELLPAPPTNDSGDTAGDLGLGRQQLLLLWLLNGQYVDGYHGPVKLEELLNRLRDVGIPRVEGFEWGVLQEFNVFSTGALLRIKGSCDFSAGEAAVLDFISDPEENPELPPNDPTRNFDDNELFQKGCDKQIHKIGKAAIRTVMARIVGHDLGHEFVLEGRWLTQRSRAGLEETVNDAAGHPITVPLTIANYGSNFCLMALDDPTQIPTDPRRYHPKRCEGFEEFVASMAIESVRQNIGIFTPQDLPIIYSFWCAKVGDGCPSNDSLFKTDEDADRFTANAINFIQTTQDLYTDVYAEAITHDAVSLEMLAQPASFPFLDKISTACQKINGTPITRESTRGDLRKCNIDGAEKLVHGTDPTVGMATFGQEHLMLVDDKDQLSTLKKQLGVKNYVYMPFRSRLTNDSPLDLYDLTLALYEGDDQDLYPFEDFVGAYDVPFVRGGTQEIIGVGKDPETGDKFDVFPAFFSITNTLQVTPRAVALFVDPDQEFLEPDKQNNQTDFYYYILDPTNITATLETNRGLTAPIDDLLPPDQVESNAICMASPMPEFEVTVRKGGTQGNGGKALTVSINAPAEYLYTIANRNQQPLKDIQVVRYDETGTESYRFEVEELAAGATVSRTEESIYMEPGRYISRAILEARDGQQNSVGPVKNQVTVNASEKFQLHTIRLFDSSELNDQDHPFSRYWNTHDQLTLEEKQVVGAVTDGDDFGGGGRIRIEITDVEQQDVPMRVALEDWRLTDVFDGVGHLEYWGADGQPLAPPGIVISSVLASELAQGARLIYVPPAFFVRPDHREQDLWRNQRREPNITRSVKLSITQERVGTTIREIKLRRPPVFLHHGLGGFREVWNRFRPLVPDYLVTVPPIYFHPMEGFDGRFDLYAVGATGINHSVETEATHSQQMIAVILRTFAPQYAVGKVDIIGNSMGGLISRRMALDFTRMGYHVPFRKLITIGTPHLGSPIASASIQIRDHIDNIDLSQDLPDLLDAAVDDPRLSDPQVRQLQADTVCGMALRFLGGINSDLGMYYGAADDLAIGSAAIQELLRAGFLMPSHHLAVNNATDDLSASIIRQDATYEDGVSAISDIYKLWVYVALACNWTPDATTLQATKDAQANGMKLLITVVGPFIPTTAITLIGKYFIGRVLPALTADAFPNPQPVLPVGNDRIVPQDSQTGDLPAGEPVTTLVIAPTDHLDIKELPAATATVGRCNGYLENAWASQSERPQTILGDKIDGSCQVIFLLEDDPEGPMFRWDLLNQSGNRSADNAETVQTLPVPSLNPTVALTDPVDVQQITLSFLTPVDGATVRPGDQITVSLAVPAGIPVTELYITSNAGGVEVPTDTLTVAITVPLDAAGPLKVFAMGRGGAEYLLIGNLQLVVAPQGLERIYIGAPPVLSYAGQVDQLHVTGRYADGVRREIQSTQTGTTYTSSDPAVVAVDADGQVQARSPGQVTIAVANQDLVSGRTLFETVDIRVDFDPEANQIPVADAGPDQIVGPETTVQLSGLASQDADDHALTYQWEQIAGRPVYLAKANTAQPFFIAPRVSEPDTLIFSLVVMDELGAETLPVTTKVTVQP